MGRLRDMLDEWKARRAGRRYVSNDIRRSARDIIGPTGDLLSGAWEHVDRDGDAYLGSFDRRVPPSLFVSNQERSRQNIPIPLVERCLEDAGDEQPEPETGAE